MNNKDIIKEAIISLRKAHAELQTHPEYQGAMDSAIDSIDSNVMYALNALNFLEPQVEPIAWESTTVGYIKYLTKERYDKLNPSFKQWYRPYKCAQCEKRTDLDTLITAVNECRASIIVEGDADSIDGGVIYTDFSDAMDAIKQQET